jgi:hypothetical protein
VFSSIEDLGQRLGNRRVLTRWESELAEDIRSVPRQFKTSTSRGVGNANLSNRTKRKENRYAGHNDDKRIIVTAAGGCDEWTVAWG